MEWQFYQNFLLLLTKFMSSPAEPSLDALWKCELTQVRIGVKFVCSAFITIGRKRLFELTNAADCWRHSAGNLVQWCWQGILMLAEAQIRLISF